MTHFSQKIINGITGFFVLLSVLLLTFPLQISHYLHLTEPVTHFSYWFIYPFISTIIIIITMKDWWFNKKNQNFHDMGALLSTGITITFPIFLFYFWYIRNMSWADTNAGVEPNAVIFLLPLGVLLTTAISQTFAVVASNVKWKIILYGIFTFTLAILSAPHGNIPLLEDMVSKLSVLNYLVLLVIVHLPATSNKKKL